MGLASMRSIRRESRSGMYVLINGLRPSTIAVLLAAFILCPNAWPKSNWKEIKPLPLFMAPDFNFNQIDSICVAPVLDIRSDKSAPIFIAGEAPSIPFVTHPANATEALHESLVELGYPVDSCGAVEATLEDLRKPSEAWLRSLKFGSSKWLLIVAIEELAAKDYPYSLNPFHHDYKPFTIPRAPYYDAGHAVASGYLFSNLKGSPELEWRDSSLGLQFSGIVKGNGGAEISSVEAVDRAVANVARRFDRRSKKDPLVAFSVAKENFTSGCDTVWKALIDALNEAPDFYKVGLSDEVDMLVLYTAAHRASPENEDHIALKNQSGGCVMEVTQSWTLKQTDDWSDLTKRMRDSIAKQPTNQSRPARRRENTRASRSPLSCSLAPSFPVFAVHFYCKCSII